MNDETGESNDMMPEEVVPAIAATVTEAAATGEVPAAVVH
jgi:hypothetical protein